MATILTKKKDTSGAPSAGDLTNDTGGAELAVNTADKRLYTKDSGGNVVEVGINPTSITTGTLNTSGAVVFNDAGADVDFRVEGDTDANLFFVDAGNDRVGVGTGSPGSVFEVQASVPVLSINGTTTDAARGIEFQNSGTTRGSLKHNASSGETSLSSGDGGNGYYLTFKTDSTERMRIDSSGNLLVAKTAQDASVAGFQVRGDIAGLVEITRASGNCVTFRRNTTDGDIAVFRKDGTTVGSIGSYFGLLRIGTGSANLVFNDGTGVVPALGDGNASDNLLDFGASNRRWDDIYATNGTIQTSDRNEKQDIEELSEAETRVAVAAKALMRKYRWKSAVAEKGDDARIHFGIIAQDLQAAFEAEGLDAGRYAMFIKGEWWEKERIIPAVEGKEEVYETQTDEEGNETQVLVSEAVEAQPEKTVIDTFETEEEAGEGAVRKERMGIRYNELLAFIIAAI